MIKAPPAHVSIIDLIEKIMARPISSTSETRITKATAILSKILIPEEAIGDLKERIHIFSETYVQRIGFQDWLNLLDMATDYSSEGKKPYHEVIEAELTESVDSLKSALEKGNPTDHLLARVETILEIISSSDLPSHGIDRLLTELGAGFYTANSWGLLEEPGKLLTKRFGIGIASLQRLG